MKEILQELFRNYTNIIVFMGAGIAFDDSRIFLFFIPVAIRPRTSSSRLVSQTARR